MARTSTFALNRSAARSLGRHDHVRSGSIAKVSTAAEPFRASNSALIPLAAAVASATAVDRSFPSIVTVRWATARSGATRTRCSPMTLICMSPPWLPRL